MTSLADAPPPSHYRFADLTLDAARRSVTRDGEAIELKSLDFDLLRFLVESAPNLVNADVLAEKVWGRHFVSPENVAQRVMLLRQSLSDDANRPRYIETVRNKGYRLIPTVERVAAGEVLTVPQRRRWLVPATAAALLVAVGAAATTRYWLAEPATQESPPSPSSVAVLPFENLSPDPADAYLAIAMRDELVSQLTKIGRLRVVPVSPGTRDPPAIPELARDLNVASVLYGSVYHAEGRVRITPRLTDAASVSLWSSSYEREHRDIFGIQADIALEVVRALRLEPSAAERESVRRVPTTNQRAHDLYLSSMGRPFSDDVDNRMEALADIEHALELDPAFKEAWVVKATILYRLAALDAGRANEHQRLSQQAALRALELDPAFGAAYRALGQALFWRNDWRGAELAFGKARSLNEPLAVMGANANLQLSAGKFGPVARDILEEGRAANPRLTVQYRLLMFVYEVLGESERASALYANALRIFPGDNRESRLLQNQRMHSLIGRNELGEARAIPLADPFNSRMLGYLDAPERALAELRHALGAYDSGAYGPEYPTRYYDIGLWAGYFGDPALAFEAMRKLVDTGGGRMAFVWMPQLASMRRLPEFKAYLREVGMVAYWQEFGWPPFCRPLDALDFECN